MTPDWQLVQSSHITALCFRPVGVIEARVLKHRAPRFGTLYVAYHDKDVWAYPNILEPVYEAILNADSAGRALNLLVNKDRGEFVGRYGK